MQTLEGSSTSPSTPSHPSKEKDYNDEGTEKEENPSNGLNKTPSCGNRTYFINQDLWLIVEDQFLEGCGCTNDEVVAHNQKKNIHVLELARILPKLQWKL